MDRLSRVLYRNLFPGAWPRGGLSPLNRVIVGLVLAGIALAILETEPVLTDRHGALFVAADVALGIIFTVEYVARLWCAGADERFRGVRGRLRYMVRPAALADLIAIGPFLLGVIGGDAFIVRLVRLLRILALARLGQFSVALRRLLNAFSDRRAELFVSLCFAFGILVIAASGIYAFEGAAQPETFGSIPRALWWAVATLTTVGYGDVFPITVIGKIFAGLIAIVAIGIIAMPTGILAAALTDGLMRREQEQDGQAAPSDPV